METLKWLLLDYIAKKHKKLNTATGYDGTQAIFLTFDAKLSFGKGTSVARKAEWGEKTCRYSEALKGG